MAAGDAFQFTIQVLVAGPLGSDGAGVVLALVGDRFQLTLHKITECAPA